MNRLLKKLLAPRRLEYLTLNRDLLILEISADVQRFADRPREVLPGNDVRAGFPELIGSEDILRAILQKQQPSFEIKGIARSDRPSPFYMDLYVTDTPNEETLENNLIVLFEDVTEMMVLKQNLVQRANETSLLLSALATSKDYIDKIINSMADALLVTTLAGQIKTVNQATIDFFGYSEEELIGQPISSIVADEQFLQKASQRLDSLSQGELLKDLEAICQTKSGKTFSVSFSCSSIQTDINGLQDVVYVGRDITERKRAEEEMRRAMEKEKELNELKSRFLSMASHEFRNPLTAILTSVALLKENYFTYIANPDEDNQLYFQIIQSSVKQMTNLLDDVLTIGKAEARKLDFNPAPLDLVKFCRAIVVEMQLTAGNKHALNFISASQSIKACMDEDLLRQILTNLLSNAIKYSPEGGSVHFELVCQDEEAIFEIQDAGIGIPPEDQKRLFESFHRGRNARKLPGTGLGLAIVKKSLELHGGRISVQSQVGVGTTFSVRLPLNKDRQSNESDVIT